MAEVSYICKRTVVSTKPVQPGKFYPLSVLDRTMEHNQLRIVYYYRSKIPRKAGEMTKILLECLSEMLTSYPVVTGRLVRDHEGHWMIKCNDAGVRMVEARAKGSMDEWLQNVDREKELKLIHWEDMYYKPYFWSTFYVQITEFEEGGLAIGLSCIHLLADPICATMLIKAWADLTLTGEIIAPPLFQPLPSLRRPGDKDINHMPYTSLINHYKSSIHESIPVSNVKLATITLAFSDEMVEATIGMAQTGCSPDESSPSPFEALAGLFWFCISKVKGVTEGLMNMSISLDMRKILGLDKGFFGNCMVYNKVHAKGFKEKGLLVEAVKAIQEVVAKMNEEGIMDLTEWLESNNLGDHYYPSMNGCDLICSNLDGVDPYLASFEEGFAPVKISYYVEPVFGEGQVLILPSPPGEGPLSRVVMVTLPEDEAVKLIEDNLIRHLISPTILMGVNKDNAAYSANN